MKITKMVEFEQKDLTLIKKFLSDRSLNLFKDLLANNDINNIEDLSSKTLLLNDLISTLSLENIYSVVNGEEFWMIGIDGMETFIEEYEDYLKSNSED